MSITVQGIEAEKLARDWLIAHGYRIFQADWIAEDAKGQYFVVEVKHQEQFDPPPFPGHGLPPYQVKSRLAFQAKSGVVSLLLVLDKGTKQWYWQRMDILEQGEHFDTNGKQQRRIYKLDSFHSEPSQHYMGTPLLM